MRSPLGSKSAELLNSRVLSARTCIFCCQGDTKSRPSKLQNEVSRTHFNCAIWEQASLLLSAQARLPGPRHSRRRRYCDMRVRAVGHTAEPAAASGDAAGSGAPPNGISLHQLHETSSKFLIFHQFHCYGNLASNAWQTWAIHADGLSSRERRLCADSGTNTAIHHTISGRRPAAPPAARTPSCGHPPSSASSGTPGCSTPRRGTCCTCVHGQQAGSTESSAASQRGLQQGGDCMQAHEAVCSGAGKPSR